MRPASVVLVGAQKLDLHLWIANQLCDVVLVRSSDAGAVVRMHAGPGA